MLSRLSPDDFCRIISSSPNAIIATDAGDPARPILFANRAFTDLTGYTPDEVIGKGSAFMLEHVNAEENAAAVAEVQDAVASNRRALVVLYCRRKDGTMFWNEISVYPVVDAATGRHLAIKSQRDVTQRVTFEHDMRQSDQLHRTRAALKTADMRRALEQVYDEVLERKRIAQALLITERKFRSVVENAVEGIYRSTPDGRYIDANPALARIYGFSNPAELLAQVDSIERDIYVDPAMRSAFRSQIERDGVVRNLEYEVRRRDGSTIWISENARVIHGPGGKVVAYEGMVQDVTERRLAQEAARHMEKQLLQAHKMEAIGTLAGGVAHDFNNILGAITGFAEMTRDELAPDSPAADNLRRILEASRRGRDLIRQILTFSRASTHQRSVVELRPIITEVIRFLQVTLPSSIRIEEEFATDRDAVVADPTQIQQVLLNLGTNAVHAMRAAGGTLRFGLRTVGLDAGTDQLPAGRYVRIHVSDTGHGMTPEVIRRIFEPFFTTKPVGEGTGLGLSVAHGIVHAHGGALRVSSAPGQGSEFFILLPEAAVPAANEAPGTDLDGGDARLNEDQASLSPR